MIESLAANDTEVLENCLNGDHQAFGEIVERYQSLICSITYSATGNLAASEDLAQDTFIAAWKHLADLRDRNCLRAWLCGIARNVTKNFLRRRTRDVAGRAVPLDRTAEPEAQAPSPRDQAISKEQESILWRALEEIPDIYREAMILYYREGQSVRLVADALGLSEGTVKQRLSRGRKMLKEQVAAFVEVTLAQTRPTKALTLAVLAALPAAASQQASAAGVAATAAKASPTFKSMSSGAFWHAMLAPIVWYLFLVSGARANISRTFSKRERRFVFWTTWGCVVIAVIFLVGLETLGFYIGLGGGLSATTTWIGGGFLVGLFAALTALVIYATRRQKRIRIEDGTYIDPCYRPPEGDAGRQSLTSLHLSACAIIIAGMSWLLLFTWVMKEWWTLCLTAALTAGLCAQAVYRIPLRPHRYYPIMIQTVVLMMFYAQATFHLHWEQWRQLSLDYHQGIPSLSEAANLRERWGFSAIIIAAYLCIWQTLHWTHLRGKKKGLFKRIRG